MRCNVWHHIAVQRDQGLSKIFIDGRCRVSSTTQTFENDTSNKFCIGRAQTGSQTYAYSHKGWIDGFRITQGMPRYTSGIPVDGQSPHKEYDDGRSSNNYLTTTDWATSSTRRYYGINTHTYLQTTQYSTDANTVLMVRGDDAETANDVVNMYGEQGFHLEFKEVGIGTERDFNSPKAASRGFGSDTSASSEFADEATVLLVRSRSNQANGSTMFVDETTQDVGTVTGTVYHNAAKSVFSVDSNTANVSIASGGTRTY